MVKDSQKNSPTQVRTYEYMGAHERSNGNATFRVWVRNALAVSVVGAFNDWDTTKNPMHRIQDTELWETTVCNVRRGDIYKYAITTPNGDMVYKADPFAFRAQAAPGTASVVWDVEEYDWTDTQLIAERPAKPYLCPMSIYEVHVGSWKAGKSLYELSEELTDYVQEMGYTHIELMPLCEHPYAGSWGYQATGFYAVSTRYGTPWDLKHFVNACHARGIRVILDWVPAHFVRDEHGLRHFDGTPMYEHSDPRRGEQPQWNTQLFDLEKEQVRSFLISNAVFWLREFHIDALRVDAVSCMLYLDYGKRCGAWLPGNDGGNINHAAVEFFRELSQTVAKECAGALLIAEESTAFPLVTMPPDCGGLGFNFKWDMGFMNDTLGYFSFDPIYRKSNHGKLTFPMMYAFSEKFILPFSHDEVVHGKCSLIGKMPGDYEQKFAQIRLLFLYQYAHPGKKLMFMGDEFAQFIEWDYRQSLDFCLLNYESHRQVREFVKRLNAVYTSYPPLYAKDDGWAGYEWITCDDAENSVIAFLRKNDEGEILCVFNFTPIARMQYKLTMKKNCVLTPLINTDSREFGGEGVITDDSIKTLRCVAAIDLAGLSGAYFTVEACDEAMLT